MGNADVGKDILAGQGDPRGLFAKYGPNAPKNPPPPKIPQQYKGVQSGFERDDVDGPTLVLPKPGFTDTNQEQKAIKVPRDVSEQSTQAFTPPQPKNK